MVRRRVLCQADLSGDNSSPDPLHSPELKRREVRAGPKHGRGANLTKNTTRPALPADETGLIHYQELRGHMATTQHTATAVAGSAGIRIGSFAQCAMAICFGLFIIGLVGFSHSEILHNAAHDTRVGGGKNPRVSGDKFILAF
jgi:cobalt transporter subunit CbtB